MFKKKPKKVVEQEPVKVKFNFFEVMEKHLPTKTGFFRKIKPLWSRDFGDDNIISYYRVNFHDPENHNFITNSYFVSIYEKTKKAFVIKENNVELKESY